MQRFDFERKFQIVITLCIYMHEIVLLNEIAFWFWKKISKSHNPNVHMHAIVLIKWNKIQIWKCEN